MSKSPAQSESKPASESSERVVVPLADATGEAKIERPAPDPTRYGDWEKNGRCIDF
jgi:hypothetical protein